MSVARARQLRKSMTFEERALWRHLRRRQLLGFHFRRQHPLGPNVVDFCCLAAKLVVEVDGSQHARTIGRDNARTAWLAARGFEVIRFWNNEVRENMEAVKAIIVSKLRENNVAPPPGQGGG